MSVKKTAISMALLFGASASSFAAGFNGPFVQLGFGAADTETKVSGLQNIDSHVAADGASSEDVFRGMLAVGYSQSYDSFNLAANVFLILANQPGGSRYSSASYQSAAHGISVHNEESGTYGLSIEPGFNITDKTLGYLKFAWVSSQHDGQIVASVDDSSSASFYSARINGFGYGLGVKQLVGKNVYLAFDLMGVDYENRCGAGSGVCFRPRQVLGFISLGYTF